MDRSLYNALAVMVYRHGTESLNPAGQKLVSEALRQGRNQFLGADHSLLPYLKDGTPHVPSRQT